jgi:preprotein translocase subunit SecB
MQLENCILTVLHIEPNTDIEITDSLEDASIVTVACEERQHPSEPKYMVDAKFTVTWKKNDYLYNKIEIGLLGIFTFPINTPKETISLYVPILCLANLYGTARGIVAQATGLCPGGAYMLPLLDMNNVVKASTEDLKPKRQRKSTKISDVK